jgi:hypothetical protein
VSAGARTNPSSKPDASPGLTSKGATDRVSRPAADTPAVTRHDQYNNPGAFWLLGTTTSFSCGAITIPDSGNGTPYPSNCVVSGLTGTITDVNLSINGYSHTYSDDVDVMLAHPTPTTNATVMSDSGGANGIVNGNLVLDDEAANQLPDATAISSGSWRPANWPAASDGFLAPAPSQSANVNLSTFDGMAPNGTWTLWVHDDLGGDMGNITSWSLDITVALAAGVTSLRAVRSHKGVIVRWRTGTEYNELGFNVYRQQGNRRVRVNRRLLPALGGISGKAYSFVDRRAPRHRAVRYWLQDVSVSGARAWHGPVRVAAA